MPDRKSVVDRVVEAITSTTLILITFKLAGYIGWSWWWVLSPLWLTFVVLWIAAAIIFAIAILA